MDFELHPNLKSKIFIADLRLCRVLLEDEENYPWIFLVPRRLCVSKMIDLSFADQLLLLEELDFAQKMLWNLFQPKQLNVAAIGNKTPQLHFHLIARYEEDPSWPGTVWEHPIRCKYSESKKAEILQKLQDAFLLKC